MLGAADALQGDVAPALKQMEPSYEATFGYGFLGVLPGVILADALASADRNQEALDWSRGFSIGRARRKLVPLFRSYGGFVERWYCDNQPTIGRRQSVISEPRCELLINRAQMFFV